MDAFGWMLIAAVPALYGLFWWLDYRWQSQQREPLERVRADELDD